MVLTRTQIICIHSVVLGIKLFNSQNHWLNDLQSTFLIISVSFSSTSCCFSFRISLKIIAFKPEAFCLCCCGQSQKRKLAVFFALSVTPLSTMLWQHAVMYPERGTIAHMYHSQESTSGSPCLVEWNSITIGFEIHSRNNGTPSPHTEGFYKI